MPSRSRLSGRHGLLATALLAALAFRADHGPADVHWKPEEWHHLEQRQHRGVQGAREVLSDSALVAFQEEVPLLLPGTLSKVLQPVTSRVPDVAGPLRLAAVRREMRRPENREALIQVLDGDPRPQYRRWLGLLKESCHVLGFKLEMPAVRSGGAAPRWKAEETWVPKHVRRRTEPSGPTLLCPELWVDAAWPPSVAGAGVRLGRTAPVWSVALSASASPGSGGAPGQPARGVLVLLARLLKTFSDAEVRALIGYELGRAAFAVLPTTLPKEWLDRASGVFMVARLMQRWQAMTAPPPPKPWWSSTALGGLGGLQLGGGGGLASLTNALQGRNPLGDWAAADFIIGRLVPWMFRPAVYGMLMARGGPENLFGGLKQKLFFDGGASPVSRHQQQLPPWLLLLMPWIQLLSQAGALQAANAAAAANGRAVVLTADRAAALAAGDGEAAAAALLRAQGLLPEPALKGPLLKKTILEAVEYAEQRSWALRREAVQQNAGEPAPEVRVREILRWCGSPAGRRLMALAEIRRGTLASSWTSWWSRSGSNDDEAANRSHWRALIAPSLLALVLVLPVLTSVDLVRWASMCTLVVTGIGIIVPLNFYGGGLPLGVVAVLIPLLIGYAICIWGVWWNHLLGGSREWAQLSSRLTSQLSESADVTVGIAYLTRDWAEMAQRSLAALDQELCGSWRTSLHELASKLTDLKQELTKGASSAAQPHQFLQTSAWHAHNNPASALTASYLAPRNGNASSEASGSSQLWLKVDRAVQQALRVEMSRMRQAVDEDSFDSLQALMAWWAGDGRATSSSSGGRWTEDREDSLGSLLLSNSLHQKFQYLSFCKGEEGAGANDEQLASAEEFRRLEHALSLNFSAVQDLRSRLAPMETAAGSLRCLRLADFHKAAAELKRLAARCVVKPKGEAELDSPEDRAEELRILASLALAAIVGGCGSIAAGCGALWLWAAASFGFGAANLVLLLNYWRLSLPHVHRRFKRHMDLLSFKREEILTEISNLQKRSQRAGAAHARASIVLQSVNVLRNINYVVLCIKTEAQRVASENHGGGGAWRVVQAGLGLLLRLIPQGSQSEAAVLSDEDSSGAVALLDRQLGPEALRIGPWPLSSGRQQAVAESQKRLLILLRMVHLSSALPIEAQGHLGALVERYLRPVLLEGRVPLRQAPTLALTSTAGEDALQQAAGNKARGSPSSSSGSDSRWRHTGTGTSGGLGFALSSSASKGSLPHLEDLESAHQRPLFQGGIDASSTWPLESSKRRDVPPLPISPMGAAEQRDRMQDRMSTSSKSFSECSESSASSNPFKQLAATRKDLSRVLGRLPPDALLGPDCPVKATSSSSSSSNGRLKEGKGMLSDLFASVTLNLSTAETSHSDGTWAFGGSRRPSRAATPNGNGSSKPALSVGWKYCGQAYTFDGLQTDLVAQVVVPLEDSVPRGSIESLRLVGANRPAARCVDLEVPLTAVLDEALGDAAASELWTAAGNTFPGRFGLTQLQDRVQALKRVTAAARAMRKLPREAA